MTDRTFDIYEFSGFTNGQLAICPEPASDDSFEKVAQWNADIIVTMITVDEFARDDFSAKITHATPQWIQAAVSDFGIPENDFGAVIDRLLAVLQTDGRILIHCKGGQGRSGMAILRLMVERGISPEIALKRIHTVRPMAVETHVQYNWASRI